jgi:DMSO/TMAO reductase YedYZ molybdopterin-dependent catalytic subunit
MTMAAHSFSRRQLLAMGSGASSLLLAGCDRISNSATGLSILESAEKLTLASQRLILDRHKLAPEFSASDISKIFKANGSTDPQSVAYIEATLNNFSDWRLKIDGLVDRPQSLSLDEIKRLPSRTQITRHDCVEGWSAIGQWTGVPLSILLKASGLKANARYLVFHCADDLGGELQKGGDLSTGRYYESIDLVDAFHPQTILAHAMNGSTLSVAHGAPLRLRVERQLGYKQAKYIMRIEAVQTFANIERGKGGYWEDRGYEWYAGI